MGFFFMTHFIHFSFTHEDAAIFPLENSFHDMQGFESVLYGWKWAVKRPIIIKCGNIVLIIKTSSTFLGKNVFVVRLERFISTLWLKLSSSMSLLWKLWFLVAQLLPPSLMSLKSHCNHILIYAVPSSLNYDYAIFSKHLFFIILFSGTWFL